MPAGGPRRRTAQDVHAQRFGFPVPPQLSPPVVPRPSPWASPAPPPSARLRRRSRLPQHHATPCGAPLLRATKRALRLPLSLCARSSGRRRRAAGRHGEKGVWSSFYVAAVVKPSCMFFPLARSALCHLTPIGLAASGGVGTPPSPTTCSPCGLTHPSPDALCVVRRALEDLGEATPSLRRLLCKARKSNGPPPPGPRSRGDAAPQYR